MKKIPIAVLAILIVVCLFGQSNEGTIPVIPIPASIQSGKGNFVLTKTAVIVLKTNDADAKRVAGFLSKKLSAATGFAMQVKLSASSNSKGNISISLINDKSLGNEGYKLLSNSAGCFSVSQQSCRIVLRDADARTIITKRDRKQKHRESCCLGNSMRDHHRLPTFWMERIAARCEQAFLYQRRSENFY